MNSAATLPASHLTTTIVPPRENTENEAPRHWTSADVTLADGTVVTDQGFGVDAYGWDDRLDDYDNA